MPTLTFDAIFKDLKQKVYHPVYFLAGEEPWYIDEIAGYIENHVLNETEREFNQTILYGRDVDAKTIISTARRYPMMANYQVVIVREAQETKDLFPRKRSEEEESDNAKSDDKDLLSDYLSSPLTSTLLVLCYKYKKPDKRTRAGKLLEKAGVYFESKKLYDNQVPAWVESYVKRKGYSIDSRASMMLAEYLGTDLSKISNELDKLMINVNKGSAIDADLIERNIGISKDYNVFELQTALSRRDPVRVNRIINYFGANPKNNPLVVTLSTLHTFFTKIISYHVYKGKAGVNVAAALGVHPFFLKDYELAARTFTLPHARHVISLLHEYDLRSKGVNNQSANDHELLREMIFRIMHPGVEEPVV